MEKYSIIMTNDFSRPTRFDSFDKLADAISKLTELLNYYGELFPGQKGWIQNAKGERVHPAR